MSTIRLKGRCLVEGTAEGSALVTSEPISFLGGVDAKTGVIIDRTHELKGKSIVGKVLVFPHGKGSSVGAYILYALAKYGKAPAAIVNEETEMIIASGCVMGGIPLIDRVKNAHTTIKSGDKIRVCNDGTLIIHRRR